MISNNNIIVIPKLIENTNIQENKLYNEVKNESNTYLEEIYHCDDFQNKKFDVNLSYWSSICYPNIIVKHKIINITNFYTLLFIIDDILENDDSNGLIARQYINILENQEEKINTLIEIK